MRRGVVRASSIAVIALVCSCALQGRGQSGDGQKPATPTAQQGGSGAPSGGNSFPSDTTNVPVMPSKENPNPPSAPGAGAGQSPGHGGGQSPAQGSGSGAGSSPGAAGSSNQFPEDTNNVPVMPSRGTPALPEGTYTGDNVAANVGLPNDDADPVKSPDDPVAEAPAENQGFSSSNIPGLDKILDRADEKAAEADQQAGKKKRRGGDKDEEPAKHKETSSEDIEVGKFEIERKNWKAAKSRFESAMVLSPEDPEVYWGLAESSRGLGQFAEARTYYKKLLDYDPDGPHGKAARKALNDPQIANAEAAPGANAPAPK